MIYDNKKRIGIALTCKALAWSLALPSYAAWQLDDLEVFGNWQASYQQTDTMDSKITQLAGRVMVTSNDLQFHLQGITQTGTGTSLTSSLTASQYQWFNLSSSNDNTFISLDRLNYAYYTDSATWVLGRQAISLGQGYFYYPLGLGNKLTIPNLDSEYQRGIDAISGDIWLDSSWLGNGNLQLITAFGLLDTEASLRQANSIQTNPRLAKTGINWPGSALVARYTSHWQGTEWAIQAGKVAGAYQLGGGLSGDNEGLAYRLELARTQPLSSLKNNINLGGGFSSAVLGLGYQATNDLHFEWEYFANGATKDSAEVVNQRVFYGLSAGRNSNAMGISINYKFTPLIDGKWIQLHGHSDNSHLDTITLTFNLSDNATLAFLWSAGQGTSVSEYGLIANTGYLHLRSFF